MSLADAVLERLTGALPDDIGVFDSTVPGIPPARYVVLYCDTGRLTADCADGVSRELDFRLQVTSVAVLNDSVLQAAPMARWIAELVRTSLTDWRPAVDGLVIGPLVHLNSRQPTPDETVADRHLVFAIDQFSTIADRIS